MTTRAKQPKRTRRNAKAIPLAQQLWPVLYEDENLLAVAKPWGIDSGRLDPAHRPGAAEIMQTLRPGDASYQPANRLSRYESGVLILGKNRTIAEHIRNGLRDRKIAQEYVAVVYGRMTKKQITVGSEHGASHGRRREKSPARSNPARSNTATKATPSGMSTTITALHAGPKRSLVVIRTAAPTTHALRAQLRAVRLRALGDAIHNQSNRPVEQQMTCLHLASLSFHHPRLKRKITIACPPPDVFPSIVDGARDVTRALFAALARRATLLDDREIDAYRLLTGPAEDLPALIVDKFGDVITFELLETSGIVATERTEIARWYREALGARSVIARWNVKTAAPKPTRDDPLADTTEHLLGEPCPDSIIVKERALKLAVRPAAGRSVGLYADHRDNRDRIRTMANGKDVLNLFAYTCGFSLAAAVGKAASTVSVDLAGKHLEWGRENFALNGLDTEAHEFAQADSAEYLRRAQRQERSFDLIILDPPSFAHGRKRGQDFSVARDLTPLVAECLAVLRPGGVMMVSTNLRRMSAAGLKQRVRAAAKGRRCRVIETPPLPDDFAVDPDHAKTLFVEFA